MRRPTITPPSLSDLLPSRAAPDTDTTWTIRLKTITPLFGGGAVAREVDPIVPIRAAAIRGHLRFWWRATAGVAYSDAAALFKAEEAIWGSAEKPGRVALRIAVENGGKAVSYESIAPRSDPQRGPREGVFLFPFAEQRREGIAAAFGRVDVAFTLTLTLPNETEDDVRRAVRAWILFGGVGARTRRGLGALAVRENAAEWLPPADMSAVKPYLQTLAGTVTTLGAPQFSRLKGGMACIGERSDSASAAWRNLGAFWSRFRKGHYTSSDLSPMHGGKWPDHGALRRLRAADREIALAKPFLGLPIIYQRFPSRGNAPASFQGNLESEASGRMASPVILKPVTFADGTIRPMIALLQAPMPRRIRVNQQPLALHPLEATEPVLTSLKAASPLEAVLKAAMDDGYLLGGRL